MELGVGLLCNQMTTNSVILRDHWQVVTELTSLGCIHGVLTHSNTGERLVLLEEDLVARGLGCLLKSIVLTMG